MLYFSAVCRSGGWANFFRFGMTTDEFLAETQRQFDEEGLRLAEMTAYEADGVRRWAAIYRSGDWAHRLTVGRDTATFLSETQTFFDREGLRLTHMVPFTAPEGTLRWAGVYVGGDWAHRLTVGRDTQTFATETQQFFDREGLRLDQLVSYRDGGTTRWAGIYTPSRDAHRFFLNMPRPDLVDETQRLFDVEGLRLTNLQVRPGAGKGVRLHLKFLEHPTIPAADMVRSMREVYASVGLLVDVVSSEDLALPLLTDLDAGSCDGSPTTDQSQLFTNRNNVGADDIVVYFCRSVVNAATGDSWNGCAIHPVGQPGAVVASYATTWTLAHEVGHVLGLPHCDTDGARLTDRLMTGGGTATITNPPPDLVAAESSTMDASALTINM